MTEKLTVEEQKTLRALHKKLLERRRRFEETQLEFKHTLEEVKSNHEAFDDKVVSPDYTEIVERDGNQRAKTR